MRLWIFSVQELYRSTLYYCLFGDIYCLYLQGEVYSTASKAETNLKMYLLIAKGDLMNTDKNRFGKKYLKFPYFKIIGYRNVRLSLCCIKK